MFDLRLKDVYREMGRKPIFNPFTLGKLYIFKDLSKEDFSNLFKYFKRLEKFKDVPIKDLPDDVLEILEAYREANTQNKGIEPKLQFFLNKDIEYLAEKANKLTNINIKARNKGLNSLTKKEIELEKDAGVITLALFLQTSSYYKNYEKKRSK